MNKEISQSNTAVEETIMSKIIKNIKNSFFNVKKPAKTLILKEKKRRMVSMAKDDTLKANATSLKFSVSSFAS